MENRYPMLKQLLAISALACLSASPLVAQGAQQPPRQEGATASAPQDRAQNQPAKQLLTEDEVRNLIKKNKKDLDVVYKALDEHGVNFDLDRKIEAKMRSAGADDGLLQAIWKVGPTGRNEKTATLTSSLGVPLHAKYEEAIGYKTMEDELDPDRRLHMVEEFERKFPTSDLLSSVYTQAAKSYREKGDLNKLVEYGEKSLKLDANNLYSLLMVAIALPQPRMQEGNADLAAQRLSTAEEYANRALKLIDGLLAKPNETDEQFKNRKGVLAADAHTALATVYMERDDSAKAIEEFKTAISLSQRPNPQLYFRLGEVYANSDKTNEAIEAFTKASELGRGTVLQQYADKRIAELKKK